MGESLVVALPDTLNMMAGAGGAQVAFSGIQTETLLNIIATFFSALVILWKLAKKDQQFETLLERVSEVEDGYIPRSEFKMYCEAQQDAIKSLVSNFNTRMDTLDSHIQDVYRQHRPVNERQER